MAEGILNAAPADPPRKNALGKAGKLARLVLSVFDPRAWLHLFKIVNYYNYTHVQPLRRMKIGAAAGISPDAVFSNPERIEIGDRARIGSRCHIWAGPRDGRVIIGDDVLFGPEVMLTAATYDFNNGSPVTDQPMREADIVIGNDVWLATRAVVLPGTTIGDGAIIAAGAVVKGDIPAMAIVAGSPARVVSMRCIA
ncbi:DapH/DapD/GlmU-related protein [Novosphingobium sp. CECT 9465]|uniref:acyltransferase n=1 Tax=Novosphingobium sp. CECT 9465 TaxID=2829794 RepID=UPI001E60C97A|nr:acyltransferase [Novosphingobium sp. CECT 9465]CAH0497927.1 2,3,4,5-tetrahydropyridine-2,6-dicarboxylate N-acetyltransferase [Novosphingobium sp. CECT 9465]